MKSLPGKVATITTGSTVPDVTTLARQARIVEAAQAYVAALVAWNERTKWDDHKRRELHLAQNALVAAVVGK